MRKEAAACVDDSILRGGVKLVLHVKQEFVLDKSFFGSHVVGRSVSVTASPSLPGAHSVERRQSGVDA